MRLGELADRIGATLSGDPDFAVTGAAGLSEASDSDVTFLASGAKAAIAAESAAGAIIVQKGIELPGRNIVAVDNPKLGFAKALEALYPAVRPVAGIAGGAHVSDNAELAEKVSVAPTACIEDGARIGKNTVIRPGAYIGRGVIIGQDSLICPNVVIMDGCRIGSRVIIHAGAVIGSDGFGYVTEDGVHHKIPQVGNVIIEDDVEIGANVTVDRATVGSTVVGASSKIDNLTQVAHNVILGPGCLVAAQTGIAGSSKLGRYVVLGGQVGLADHVALGDGVMVGAQSGIPRDVPAGTVVSGTPAISHRNWLRASMVFQRLPEIERRLRALEKALEVLEGGDAE